MKLSVIKYNLDSGISVYCEESQEEQFSSLRYAIVNYDISLINEPLKKVREQCKIYKENIEFQQHRFILFFPLDNIISPYESHISFRSIIFSTEGNKKIQFVIDETYSFKELQKNSTGKSIKTKPLENLRETYQENLQEGKSSSLQKGPPPEHNILSSENSKEGTNDLFVDSLKQFTDNIRGSNLEELIS